MDLAYAEPLTISSVACSGKVK